MLSQASGPGFRWAYSPVFLAVQGETLRRLQGSGRRKHVCAHLRVHT